jgi:hypothetical protein
MEYWNGGIVERICVRFFFILYSVIGILNSAIEAGGDLMLWIMDNPERGSIRSSNLKSKSKPLRLSEVKHGQDH